MITLGSRRVVPHNPEGKGSSNTSSNSVASSTSTAYLWNETSNSNSSSFSDDFQDESTSALKGASSGSFKTFSSIRKLSNLSSLEIASHEDVLQMLLRNRFNNPNSCAINNCALLEMISLPPREDVLNWLSTLSLDFFEDTSLLIETCLSFPTSQQPADDGSKAADIKSLLKCLEKQLIRVDEKCSIDFEQGRDDPRFGLGDRVDIDSVKILNLLEQVVVALFKLYEVLYRCHARLLDQLGLLHLLKISSKRFLLFLLQFKLVPANNVLCFAVTFRS